MTNIFVVPSNKPINSNLKANDAFQEALKNCQPDIKIQYGKCEQPESSIKSYEGELHADWNSTKDSLMEWAKTPVGAMVIYEYTRQYDLMVDTEDKFTVCFRWQG